MNNLLHKYTATCINRFFIFSIVFIIGFSGKSHAQEFCSDETIYWFENFGTGITPVSHPDIIPGSLIYQPSGILNAEGTYRVINNTQQMPEWHFSADHTPGDVDGRVLVINGQSETFFSHTISLPGGFLPGPYASSLYLMNVNTPGTCSPNPLLPYIDFKVEYLNQNNAWVPLQNSPVTSNFVPQSANPTWVLLGGVFILPSTGAFTVTQIRVILSNQTTGGCGNDYAIDDIKFASCPTGGPVPVIFNSVTANVKGSGVLVNWSTSSEINNDRYDVERSTDQGRNWIPIATVKGRGNYSSLAQYQAYDAKPSIGRNLYRIKQIDFDGRSKYSVTVGIQVETGSTNISVLTNPIRDRIILDFLSDKNQMTGISLIDITGKPVLKTNVAIMKGSSRKEINVPASLGKGLYILQVVDEEGNLLLREKLIR